MLLEFKTKNYKSFVEETKFSMLAAPKQKGLDYSLCKEKVKGKILKGLCSSVIYGPNASGKTNIIGAMDVFRAIVLRGNIRNSELKTSPNLASAALELIPNNKYKEAEPVEFLIDFYDGGLRIEYSLSVDFGTFLDVTYQRKILSEKLIINGYEVFNRTKKDLSPLGDMKLIKDYLSDSMKQNTEGVIDIAKNSLNQEELFLTNGFKLICSQRLVKLITDWFRNKLTVIYRADSMQLGQRFKNGVYLDKTIEKAARLFGIDSNAIAYVSTDDESDSELCSIIEGVKVKDKKGAIIPAELFESYGTIRFVNMFPLIVDTLKNGGTLAVDEFDASIHPMAIMNIVNVFHNNDLNTRHAQLIFNTHNPIFLNSNLFRRDEIKFVERDEESHNSTLYALSDFGTTGDKGVRKHEDYMNNYFLSRYGAIKDIDFSPIFEELLATEGEV